ncbi:MAG TPA: Yip1 family protein [Anaerolineae bacterium]|nr:Yip1 family protein [Anaerolineae bacterium]
MATMKRYQFRPRLQPPWQFIWFHPQATLREILTINPGLYVIPLAILSGLARAFDFYTNHDWINQPWWNVLLLRGLGIGVLGGLVMLYAGGFIFQWTGRLFGGQASPQQVRTALAWGSIPDVLQLLIYLLLLALNQASWFSMSALSVLYAAGWLASIGLWIWKVLLLIVCLTEAHRFSIWRGLGTLLVGALIVGGLLWGLLAIARATSQVG